MSYRIVVTGGRTYSDRAQLFATLDSLNAAHQVTDIGHGGAKGADTLAGEWARARGVDEHVYAADWSKHGPAAGPIRNKLMLRYVQPILVVAFPGGRGTADCVRQARGYCCAVLEVAAQEAV